MYLLQNLQSCVTSEDLLLLNYIFIFIVSRSQGNRIILTSKTCSVIFFPQEPQLEGNEYSLPSFPIAEPFEKLLQISIPSSSIELSVKICVSPVKWVLKSSEAGSNDTKVRILPS